MTAAAITATPLAAVLARECARCEHIETAWASPHAPAYAVQAGIGVRWRSDGHWNVAEPVYASAEAIRAIGDVLARIRKALPDALAYYASYRFRPGPSWVVAYQRGARA